jgi:tungstate transport system substrate-binding protein
MQSIGTGVRVRSVPTTLAPRRALSLTRNRVAVVFLAVLAVLVGFALDPPASRAEPNTSTLTIVGTSDVSDSGLSNVLTADFTSFYDSTHQGANISVGYKGEGTQAAINDAEAGNGSALIVHAASLENQFVGDGFSLEQFGRAVFHGDFVLLGPKSDPANVDADGDADNVVGAFQDIAAAGASSKANFISRSDNSGTNVEEHEIWALTTGVTMCAVSTANGGGTTPATATGDCPQTAPSWYQATNDHSQSANVEFTNACTGLPGGTNTCYTITDRGTYDNLEKQGLIPNLKVINVANSASAPGKSTLLVNSFHAYAINPAAVPSTANLNPTLALAFIKWLSSPAGQTASNNFLKDAPGGSPFLKDAAPVITASTLPGTVRAGKSVTVTGSLKNVVPGTPALVGKKVTLSALRTSVAKANPGAKPVVVKSVLTRGPKGTFSFTFRPNANAKYTVTTAEISQIENDSLSPPFGDLLSPASKSLGRMNVRASVAIHKASAKKGLVTIKGGLSPASTGAFAHLSLYAGHSGHALKFVGRRNVRAGKHSFVLHFHLARGTWRLRLKYVTAGQTLTGTSATRSVTVR